MRIRQSFIALRAVTALSLVLAAAFIAVFSILPNAVMERLERSIVPRAASAIEKTQKGDTLSALEDVLEMKAILEDAHEELLMLFAHGDIIELNYCVRTAEELARSGDTSQLLTELTGIESVIWSLRHRNEATLSNLL